MPALITRIGLAALSGLVLSLSFPFSLPPIPAWLAPYFNFDLPTTPALGSLPIPLPNALMPQPPELGYVQIPWICFLALVPLLASIRRLASPGPAFWLGYLSGSVCHCLSLLWLGSFGPLAVIGLSTMFGLGTGLFSYLAWWIAWGPGQGLTARAVTVRAVWGCAALWTAIEYVRSFGFWAYPWLLLGYSQAKHLALIQCADLGGVYLVSFLAALANMSLAWLLFGGGPVSLRIGHMMRAAGLFCLAIAYGLWRMESLPSQAVASTAPIAAGTASISSHLAAPEHQPRELHFALIQGGLSSREEWTPQKRVEATRSYCQPSRKAILNFMGAPEAGGRAFSPGVLASATYSMLGSSEQARASVKRPKQEDLLVIWPESCLAASNISPRQLDFLPAEVKNLLRDRPSCSLLLGAIGSPKVDRVYENGCMLLENPSKAAWPYAKVRLVPYGEVTPLRQAVRFLDFPWNESDITGGRSIRVLEWRGRKIAPMICFDNVFGFVPREMARQGAEFLVLMTNNSWYELRDGIRQHCDIDILRAVELRRPLARVSTTGWSHTIDVAGRTLTETGAGGPGVIEGSLLPGPPSLLPHWLSHWLSSLPNGETLLASKLLKEPIYVNLGDLFAQLCLLASLALCVPPLVLGRGEDFI